MEAERPPKGLSWPQFKSWYSRAIGTSSASNVSREWKKYKEENNITTKKSSTKKSVTKKSKKKAITSNNEELGLFSRLPKELRVNIAEYPGVATVLARGNKQLAKDTNYALVTKCKLPIDIKREVFPIVDEMEGKIAKNDITLSKIARDIEKAGEVYGMICHFLTNGVKYGVYGQTTNYDNNNLKLTDLDSLQDVID